MPNGADSFVALANLACLLGVILVVFALLRTVRRIRVRLVPMPGGYAGGTPALRVAHDYAMCRASSRSPNNRSIPCCVTQCPWDIR